jgi:hypothetical protein
VVKDWIAASIPPQSPGGKIAAALQISEALKASVMPRFPNETPEFAAQHSDCLLICFGFDENKKTPRAY